MEDCLFCKWKNEKEKIIIENDLVFARPDEFAVSPGHTLFMTNASGGREVASSNLVTPT